MFNLTDTFICFLALFYAYSGWRKGFIKSILGPVSFVVCAMFAWVYFKKTHNVLISFFISILGPLLINQFVGWVIDIDRGFNARPSPGELLGRYVGSAITFTWGMAMSLLVILFLAVGSPRLEFLQSVRTNILSSLIFSLVSARVAGFLPAASFKGHVAQAAQVQPENADTQQLPADRSLAQTQEFASVFNDARVKDLLADPQVEQLMKDKDYLKLLQNPKFAKILEDPQLVAKMFQLQAKLKKIN